MEESEPIVVAEQAATDSWLPVWSPTLALVAGILTLIYFADILIRSANKLYWYDELFTVYLCELPKFSDTWTALLQGGVFNTALFDFLTPM